MRLSSLKLAGFKSFADSTTLHFPENRSAIVGPNGCGKSNVIDAIRWVMGESNARQLRGGSMQDVIFAGTAQRKPVGVASVELRFDNTYGKLGGAYNAYTELSIKRQVTREGKSEYFLNGTRCRRKDITDIFLGTGLGPRSYAVIEQGMINRLVDAKPEEMRVFIEEAAGVSRYQARRKETLQHLEQTQSNLARLHDIAQELQSQIKTLTRQAEQAQRYQKLKNQILDTKFTLYTYQYNQLIGQISTLTQQMTLLTEQYQSCKKALDQTEIESLLLQQKIQQQLPQSESLQTAYQTAQQKQQKIEWQLSADEKNHQQQLRKIEQIEQQIIDLSAEQQRLTEQLEQIEIQLKQLQQQFDALAFDQDEHSQIEVLTAELQHKKIQQQEQEKRLQVLKQQEQQLYYQIEQIEKSQTRFDQQLGQLTLQYQQCISADDQYELEDLQLEIATQQLKRDDLYQTIEQQQYSLNQQQEHLGTAQQKLNDVLALEKNLNREIEQTKNLLSNLQQQQPESKSNSVLAQLELTAQGHQYSQWVEKLLDGWLWAQCYQQKIEESESARQLYFTASLELETHAVLKPITAWIIVPVHPLWASVYIAKDLNEAKHYVTDLKPQQSIVTQDGYWLAKDWQINFNLDQAAKTQGYLAYQSHLHLLESQAQQVGAEIEPLQQQVISIKQQIEHAAVQLRSLNESLKSQLQFLENLNNKQIKLQGQIEHQQLQASNLEQQIHQLQQLKVDDQEELQALQLEQASVKLKLQELEPEAQVLQQAVQTLQEALNHQSQMQQQKQQQHQKLQLELQQQQAKQALLQQDVTFKTERLGHLSEQQLGLKKAAEHTAHNIAQQQTQFTLIAAEVQQHHQKWIEWQAQAEHLQIEQNELNKQRVAQQTKENQLRDALEQARLKWQECNVQQKHVIEQIEALGQQPKVVEMAQIDCEKLQKDLEAVEQQLSRLGGVNLAAFEELQGLQSRYDELDHQIQDLEKTIEHLNAAMKSIDQETKHLFMKVFDKINQELQELFPKIFSGGEASLTLESDWQSGVRLMARPPGKRNSTLALLSGGEKALTALALVFAIFRLNPAPFCVLDEVDAPLDDANVDRFCNLVKELSQQVQFIYITHNKLAMTMATDLLGVTMPEAGSSRLVAVSLAQAEAYTA